MMKYGQGIPLNLYTKLTIPNLLFSMPDIFLHIHKTGGMALTVALERLYEKSKIYHINGEHQQEDSIKFKNLPPLERNRYNLIKGHMFYGFHEFLEENVKYFTILRDPKKRIVSLYNYLYNHRLYPEIQNKNISFKSFLKEEIFATADNGIARFISGIDYNELPYGQSNKDLYEKAIENIKRNFLFIGDVEEYDASLLILGRLLNWPKPPFYDRLNQSQKKVLNVNNINFEDPEIEKYIKYDKMVYTFAKEYFSDQIIAFKNNHKDLIAEFKMQNQKFQNQKMRLMVRKLKLKFSKLIHNS